MSTDRTDAELEQLLRETLSQRATQAPVRLPTQRRPVDARRRTQALRIGATAAAAVAVVGIVMSWSSVSQSPIPPAPTAAAPSTANLAVPAGWRVESYAGIQLAVPGTWGWGGSPGPGAAPGGTGDPANEPFQGEVFCGIFGSFVSPDGQTTGNTEAKPFVGRPMMMTDACGDNPNGHPRVDAVWFSTSLPLGEKRFDDGQVALTRQVGDVTFTVFARDDALRARIAESAVAVRDVDAHGCPPELPSPSPPEGAPDVVQVGDPAGLSVCLYRHGALFASSASDAAAARAYLDSASQTAGQADDRTCLAIAIEGQNVVLGVRSSGGATRWDTIDPVCGVISTPGGAVALTDRTAGPWASPVLKAYVVSGPVQGEGTTWFRGIVG